jgi:NAD(P)-dependent dehydrogenase (short-subunit alcohol dehydrogenase family)
MARQPILRSSLPLTTITRHPRPMLAGKVITIIGGTTGLGLSAARAIVAAGAKVVIAGRNPDSAAAALAELGPDARAVIGDAALSDTAERAVSLAIDSFGKLDGLYHVAGGSGRKFGDGPLHEVTDDGVRATLALNLDSVIFSNRAAVRAFIHQNSGGVILNMASVLGWSPSPRFFSTHVYAAAKAAIIGFSKSTAACYAPHNIRINVVAPALVDTPMASRAASNNDILSFIRAKQPLDGGRIGHPEDLDAAVVWLLSDAARFCTGQTLAIDGGWSVSEGI